MTRLYTSHVEFETLWGSDVYVHDGYMRTNKKIDSHITKIQRAFRRSVPFRNFLREPMSIDVRVMLLVEDDKTIYIRPYIELRTL